MNFINGTDVIVNLDGKETSFSLCAHYMDNEIRERLHAEMPHCSEQDFLDAYVAAHAAKFDGEQFTVN